MFESNIQTRNEIHVNLGRKTSTSFDVLQKKVYFCLAKKKKYLAQVISAIKKVLQAKQTQNENEIELYSKRVFQNLQHKGIT